MHSIRSRGEASNDVDTMFDYNEAVAELVDLEERIVEEHRAVLQSEKEMLAEEEKLLDEVEGVDGDTEGMYACIHALLCSLTYSRLLSQA